MTPARRQTSAVVAAAADWTWLGFFLFCCWADGSAVSGRGGSKPGAGGGEDVLERAGRGQGELDASHAHRHLRADFQQLEADGAAGRRCQHGSGKGDAAQRAQEHVGHRCEPQPQLVGAHGGGRRAVGHQIELAFLDAVLHIAARAVDVLVEERCGTLGCIERGDDEARIGLPACPFGLADHAAFVAPAVQRAPHEVPEAACRSPGGGRLPLGGFELAPDPGDQAIVSCQAEHIVDAIVLAPRHQRLAGKAAVGPQDDLHLRPALADLSDDARRLFYGSGRGVDVGAAQLGCEQVPAAEDVEWKITIAIVVAVEEAALLVAVQGIVGGVEVEDDALGRRGMRLQEQRHEQALDLARVMADLVVAARREGGPFLGRMLQPVERALARHRRAVTPPRLQLAGQHRHGGIVAQLIVVVEILVAQRQAEHALADQRRNRVLDLLTVTAVPETGSKAIDQTDRLVRRPEQQRTGIRRDQPAVERTHNPTPANGSEVEQILATLCRHRGAPLLRAKSFSQKNFR